jgi:hypothetical protein
MTQTLHVAQLCLGLVFAASAWSKLRDPARFADVVRGYAILPRGASGGVARGIAAAEAGVAVTLLTGAGARGGALACALLLAVFLAAVAIVLHRRQAVSCGCFGADDEHVSRATMARLVVMSGAAWATAIAWLVSRHDPLTIGWIGERGASAAEHVIVSLALAAGVLVAAGYAASATALRGWWQAQRFEAPGRAEGSA